MFAKPLSQVEFADVETFCNTFGEGVRVEYKREMIDTIPKTISAFANTMGGLIVIGVEIDKVNNRATAINGIDTQAGIEESIVDSSLNGIYPAVIPEVKIFEVPGRENKIVVVIKVHESIEAPHAIQNSTRVYIRTGSTSQPYELAEIDRIEYMLKRREKPESLKDELRQRALDRLQKLLGGHFGPHAPALSISILPPFPYRPLISLDEMYAFCNELPYLSRKYISVDNPQRITDGICKFYGNVDNFSYNEINHYGLVFVYGTLSKTKSQWKSGDPQEDGALYIRFAQFVWEIGRALNLAKAFYDKCRYLGNLEVKVEAANIANECLLYNEEGFPQLDQYKSLDNSVCSSQIIMVEEINFKLLDIVTSITANILWVFNVKTTNSIQIIERILAANGLMKKTQGD